MRLLAFDTAGNGCACCVWDEGEVVARAASPMRHGQAEALMPMLLATLEEAGIGWSDLDRLAVTVGPGSFTGLRVGLATARALALAASLPVVGVTTLEVFAAQAATARPHARSVLAVVDSRREDVFVQAFCRQPDAEADLLAMSDPLAVDIADLPDMLAKWECEAPLSVGGDAVSRLVGVLDSDVWRCSPLTDSEIDPAWVAILAARREASPVPPSALYIRPPDAALPRNGGRLRP